MAIKVDINDVANEITKWLTEYSEEVTDVAKDVVDKVSEEANQEILNHITFHDKTYSKGFRIKTTFENSRNKKNTWFVAKEYRLTHLLEYGHITRNGGRTRAFPHIKYGNEFVKNNFEREMKEAIQKCKI